ncbi:MAG: hypothetical protein GF365_00310 [Candidatus Buchananbacteria bacterium]|nr:hypothetical protein [Candidatus Buchananbacteria bacterium]
MFFVLVLLSFTGCSFFNNLGVTSAPVSGPQMTVTPGPLAGDSVRPAVSANKSPISLSGSGGGTVEIEPIPDPSYGETFNAAYLTWYANKNDRSQKFRQAGRLTFDKVLPGEYLLNFRWDTGRWVVETQPPVEGEHRPLNGRIRVRFNGGPWHEFTSADTFKTGQYWNLRLVVP